MNDVLIVNSDITVWRFPHANGGAQHAVLHRDICVRLVENLVLCLCRFLLLLEDIETCAWILLEKLRVKSTESVINRVTYSIIRASSAVGHIDASGGAIHTIVHEAASYFVFQIFEFIFNLVAYATEETANFLEWTCRVGFAVVVLCTSDGSVQKWPIGWFRDVVADGCVWERTDSR